MIFCINCPLSKQNQTTFWKQKQIQQEKFHNVRFAPREINGTLFFQCGKVSIGF